MMERHKRFLAEHAYEAITDELVNKLRLGLTQTLRDGDLHRTDWFSVRAMREVGVPLDSHLDDSHWLRGHFEIELTVHSRGIDVRVDFVPEGSSDD